MSDAPANELLFTYGTLGLPQVQLDTFGRHVEGDADLLPGYTVDYVDIEDPHVVAVTGHAVHPILRHTGNPLDKAMGHVLAITDAELEAADEYEVELYHRMRVRLVSGRDAWVYVAH